jgi:hypothetical protein
MTLSFQSHSGNIISKLPARVLQPKSIPIHRIF